MPTGADPAAGLTWGERFAFARAEVASILGRIWPYLLVGIALGAAIHGWVPRMRSRSRRARQSARGAVSVLLGVPLYSNAAGVLPLIEALHAKASRWGRCWPS